METKVLIALSFFITILLITTVILGIITLKTRKYRKKKIFKILFIIAFLLFLIVVSPLILGSLTLLLLKSLIPIIFVGAVIAIIIKILG